MKTALSPQNLASEALERPLLAGTNRNLRRAGDDDPLYIMANLRNLMAAAKVCAHVRDGELFAILYALCHAVVTVYV